MKNLMYRYFMKNRTYHFINILQDLVKSYNKRPHRSLVGNAPANVNKENADEIRLESYLSGKTKLDVNQSKTLGRSKEKKEQNPFSNLKLEMMSDYHNSNTLFKETINRNGQKSFLK